MTDIIISESARQSFYEKTNFLIYGHYCKTTGKWYVGQTSYINDLDQRFGKNGSCYLKKVRNGKYKHPKFANAITKYGWDAFEHHILEYATPENVDEKETFWISEKKSLEDGYNSTYGGKATHKLTEENKAKISNPVLMKDLDGNTLKEFKSAKEAAIYIGSFNNSPIIECCKGYRKTTAGYMWSYKNGKSIREDIIKKTKIVLEGYHIKTKVCQYDTEGNQIKIFDSAIDAEVETGIKASCIYRCCRHERKTTGGYCWEYILPEATNDL